ncbi:MAG: type II secretion system F family protein [Acidimicrobiia bacterium]|nr:type II secretion system F family protein [Acidimicrobiia bacterium]
MLEVAVFSSFVAVAAGAYYVGNGITRARDVTAERLAKYGRKIARQEEAIRERELKRPFADRAIAPMAERFGRIAGRFTPIGWIERTEKRLTIAGSPGSLDANSWAVIKVVAVVAGVLLWFVIQGGLPFNQKLLTFGLLVGAGFLGPDAILNRKMAERSDAILRQLPDILDLLVISVEAGLGFDQAMARVVATVPGPLSDEFARMNTETRVGVSRKDAMRSLRDRTDVDELRGFLLAMMQADSFGVSIARVLRVQAEEMRIKRRQRAQEKAYAAPVKLVGPLMLLIFAFLTVLLGPAGLRISDTVIF